MEGEKQNVLLTFHPKQRYPQKRSGRKVKGPLCLGRRQTPRFVPTPGRRKILQFDHVNRNFECRSNHLNRLPVANGKSCAQGFVPAHDGVDAVFQRRGVQRTAEANRGPLMIDR